MARETNRWRGFFIGMAGSLAGLMAMRAYWQYVAPKIEETVDLGGKNAYPQQADLDNISVVGQQHKEEESSTAALGRMLYQTLTGKEPRSKETKELLSYLVHWGYGLLQGGMYGAMRGANDRGKKHGLDLMGGTAFATGLWLLGDEVAVPMLGLQEGPTAVSPTAHINRLGAHLAYGLATATTTRLLSKVF
jgi:hypothetical protein